jgi:hypothetical protein
MSTASIYFELGVENNTKRNDRDYLILVEGTDDAHFLDKILTEIGAEPTKVGLILAGGKGQIKSNMTSLIKSSNFTTKKTIGIAIIRDADNDFEKAERETQEIFRKILDTPVKNANSINHDGRAFGFYLLPQDKESGDLEKLSLYTVEGSPVEKLAEEFIQQASLDSPLDQIHKRKVQVFLSGVKGELCRGPGLAFKQGHFDSKHGSLNPLKDFLRKFLNLQTIS